MCATTVLRLRHVNLISGVGWHDFHKKIRKAQRAAFRPGTFANLKCHLRTYLLFCGAFDRQLFPVKKDTICAYSCFLAENFKSFNSVQNYMSGVKTWSSLLEYNNDAFQSPMLKLTLTGLSKLNLSVPNRRLPFQPQHLLDIYESLDLTLTEDSTLWALLLVAFFAMLRKSQFANTSRKSFSVNEQLTRGDFRFTEKGMVITIKWSKTRQRHNQLHIIPLSRLPIASLCPVTAYSHMLEVLPALPDEPAFGFRTKSNSLSPFSKSDIDNMIRKVVVRCSLNPQNYSFHGLRRGGASLASAAGCSDSDICAIGDWASSCYKGYIMPELVHLYRVSEAMGAFCANYRDS